MRRPRTLLAISILASLAAAGGAPAQAPAVRIDPDLPFATRRILDVALEAPSLETGETAVASGDTVAGALTQVGGSLLLEGTVTGGVTAVDARVTLRPGARIDGRLTILAGTFVGTTMAAVRDSTIWLRQEPLRVVPAAGGGLLIEHVPPESPFPLKPAGLFGLVPYEYNRVDGLALGVRAELRQPRDQPRTELSFGPVLRTARWDDVGWDVAGLRELPRLGVTVGGRVYSITDTPERWQRADVINSLAALLLTHDRRTYHEREGYEVWVEREFLLPPVTVRAMWRDDAFDSLPSEDPFAVLDDDWPVNPPAMPGDGRALGAALRWDRRDAPEFPTRGLLAALELERWGFGGDFDFTRARADLRGYLPLGDGGSFASLRVIGAGRLGGRDTLAPQFRYRLGGARSLPGYDEPIETLTGERIGDRMALANLRLHVPLPWSNRVFERMYLVGMGDAGDAWVRGESAAWNAAAGAGLAGRGQTAYLGVFGAYGFESGEWKLYLLLGPW